MFRPVQRSDGLIRGVGAGRLVRLMALLLAAAPLALRAQSAESCTAPASGLSLDHVVVATGDLDVLSSRMRALGFTLKEGRRHDDGLRNRHIKFADGSEIELMTVAGEPTSDIARGYASRLAEGDGGAYAALRVADVGDVEQAANRFGLGAAKTELGPWTFIAFPHDTDASALFFLSGGGTVTDADSLFRHPNGTTRFRSAAIEAGPAVDTLLSRLGSHACNRVRLPDARIGERWALARGTLVLVRPRPARSSGSAPSLPRLLAVELERRERRDAGQPVSLQPLAGPLPFWIVLQ